MLAYGGPARPHRMVSPARAGAWRADRRHGEGRMSFRDGSCYEGAWARGERNGLGRMRAPGGDVFVGAFTDGLRMGPGMLLMVCARLGRHSRRAPHAPVCPLD